jgi:transcriptional regulator with XRE-family HTH domain
MSNAESARAVIGANARRIREAAGLRQDDIATLARTRGLAWPRTTVAAVERGAKSIGVEELVVLASVLATACRVPVTLADMFDGAGEVVLSPKLTVKRSAIRRVLSGERVAFKFRDLPGDPAEKITNVLGRVAEFAKQIESVSPTLLMEDYERAERTAGEAEERAARTLNLEYVQVVAVAAELWGRSLTEERDARVRADIGADADQETARAKRGRVTRQLVAQIREALDEGHQHGKR